MIFAIVSAAVLLMLIWTTVKGRDAFPFSHYPMFSNPAEIETTQVFRLALETIDGKIYWWKSEFYRYPEFVGRKLEEIYEADADPKLQTFLTLRKQRLLREVLRLVTTEAGTAENLKALRVVKRTMAESDGELTARDEIVETIPVELIVKNERG